MSALFSCPRCTQALPVSSAFCRRCGAAVEFSSGQAPMPVGKSSSMVTPVLTALLISAVIAGGVVLFGVRHIPSSTVVPVAPIYSGSTSYNTPAQQTYPAQVDPRYQTYPHQIIVTPVYPEYHDRRNVDDRNHLHEQGR